MGRPWRSSPLRGGLPGLAGVWPDSLSAEEAGKPFAAFLREPPHFSTAPGFQQLSLEGLSVSFTFSFPHFTCLRPAASLSFPPPLGPCPPFPQVFSERYLISVKAGLTSTQYALPVFVLVGRAEGSCGDSG